MMLRNDSAFFEVSGGAAALGSPVVPINWHLKAEEVAYILADSGAAYVAISVRTPPPIVPRDPFGMPVQQTSILLSALPTAVADRLGHATARLALGDLTRYGMPKAVFDPYARRRVPLIDVGFVDALKRGFSLEFSFLDYHEHAVGRGANATAASYVEIQDASGRVLHGVGIDPSIVTASLKATLSAVMRLMAEAASHGTQLGDAQK